MEKKIDIIPFLAGIVEENTHSYQSDFTYDKVRLQAAMLEPSQENRTFLWMSRPCGTYCFLEREVFIKETPAHIVWTNSDYIAEADKIKALRVIVSPGREGAFVLGTVKPLNYGEQARRVQQNAIHAQSVEIVFVDGEARAMPYHEFSRDLHGLVAAHGKIRRLHYKLENEAELTGILQTERMISTVKKRPPRKKKPPTWSHPHRTAPPTAALSEQVCHLVAHQMTLVRGRSPLKTPGPRKCVSR